MRGSLSDVSGDFFGAFADTAILLPILWALSAQAGLSLPWLLASAGLLYLVSGLCFRAPMPVQPLKSLAISALALGAGPLEIRAATLAIGAVFLSLYFFAAPKVRLPEELIRCMQWSLGILLIGQGFSAAPPSFSGIGAWALIAALLLTVHRKSSWPFLGILTFGIFLSGVGSLQLASSVAPELSAHSFDGPAGLRMPVLAAMIFPQIALTLSNSVLGTELAFREYFPDRKLPNLKRRLLLSIGAGNLLMGALGGLPFCHGSGGLTAHLRAGARTARMNGVIGASLLLLSFAVFFGLKPPSDWLPALPLGAVLAAVGVHHLALGRNLLAGSQGRALLATASLITLLSGNLLYALAGAGAVYLLSAILDTRRKARQGAEA